MVLVVLVVLLEVRMQAAVELEVILGQGVCQ
jgi:hypothetical protein